MSRGWVGLWSHYAGVFALACTGVSVANDSGATEKPEQSTAGSGTVLELQSTIVGNQEQPEVITIVPWKQIDAPAPSYQPMQAIVDDKFELLDRDEWRRRIQLNKAISSSASTGLELDQ